MMNVELIDSMGNDKSVVRAARVSFARIVNDEPMDERDERLINYLAKHNHELPFAHTSLTLRVTAPIFIARQLGKHQVGLVWNEISRRYVDKEVELWYPREWRKRAPDKKQGSLEEPVLNPAVNGMYEDAVEHAVWAYEEMIKAGVCPEQARAVLPQAAYTTWIWTGSLLAFARVCKLRLAPDSQKECAEVAQKIYDICEELFPVSWKGLMG